MKTLMRKLDMTFIPRLNEANYSKNIPNIIRQVDHSLWIPWDLLQFNMIGGARKTIRTILQKELE